MSARPKNASRAAALRRAAALAVGRTPGVTGRPEWQCTCGSRERSTRAKGVRLCDACHPKKTAGRPRTRKESLQVASSLNQDANRIPALNIPSAARASNRRHRVK